MLQHDKFLLLAKMSTLLPRYFALAFTCLFSWHALAHGSQLHDKDEGEDDEPSAFSVTVGYVTARRVVPMRPILSPPGEMILFHPGHGGDPGGGSNRDNQADVSRAITLSGQYDINDEWSAQIGNAYVVGMGVGDVSLGVSIEHPVEPHTAFVGGLNGVVPLSRNNVQNPQILGAVLSGGGKARSNNYALTALMTTSRTFMAKTRKAGELEPDPRYPNVNPAILCGGGGLLRDSSEEGVDLHPGANDNPNCDMRRDAKRARTSTQSILSPSPNSLRRDSVAYSFGIDFYVRDFTVTTTLALVSTQRASADSFRPITSLAVFYTFE